MRLSLIFQLRGLNLEFKNTDTNEKEGCHLDLLGKIAVPKLQALSFIIPGIVYFWGYPDIPFGFLVLPSCLPRQVSVRLKKGIWGQII